MNHGKIELPRSEEKILQGQRKSETFILSGGEIDILKGSQEKLNYLNTAD